MAFDPFGLSGQAYKDSCNAAGNSPYFSGSSDRYEPMFPSGPERQGIYGNENPLVACAGAYANGFSRGTSHPIDTTCKYSGVGLFVNFMLNPEQSDFNQVDNAYPSGIVQFCDQAGEVTGAWLVVRTAVELTVCGTEVLISRVFTSASREASEIALAKAGLKNTAIDTADVATTSTGQLIKEEIAYAQESLLGTINARIVQLEAKIDLNALSRAGQVLDRNGLTKVGRALDKHGGRTGSVFPKATGSPANKNLQGQFHLDDILSHPQSSSFPNRLMELIFLHLMVEELGLTHILILPDFYNH